jgi:predicted ATP-dependent endonuclease of OLD family
VDCLWLEATENQQLVLIDEPAYSLHPSAQRAVARLFSIISEQHQVVYATHSPFIIDWSFPQRVRLLERDPITKRTRIQNRPYHAHERFQTVWDPLREAIGVSLGDLAVIGDTNVLVEGVSDQILLANAGSILHQRATTSSILMRSISSHLAISQPFCGSSNE